MARNKNYARKKRYATEMAKLESVPTWVVLKTNRRVRDTPTRRRNWRTSRIRR